MKFRPYQLLFVASIALLVAALVMPVLQFIEPNGATMVLHNFHIEKADGTLSYVSCALGVVLSFTILVNLFGMIISSFQNFELQKRTSILGVLLLTGYNILLLVCSLLLLDGADVQVEMAMLFPFIALILNVMCFMSARRTEAKILARASGFRLRD
ncbi:MAG: DUF4293 family protein [Bacteroidaceae bacterium]|nr:DUF4293 family protein [Bacteroidaceae bacterium]MBQ3189454.1 DUF4293 family protein [Bacteroidaceae bacterium]